MATDAVYVNGESQLPQARPASAVAPAYVNGESGLLALLAYVVTASFQFARPISDIDQGDWTPSIGSDLYAMVDEDTPDDADYITSG